MVGDGEAKERVEAARQLTEEKKVCAENAERLKEEAKQCTVQHAMQLEIAKERAENAERLKEESRHTTIQLQMQQEREKHHPPPAMQQPAAKRPRPPPRVQPVNDLPDRVFGADSGGRVLARMVQLSLPDRTPRWTIREINTLLHSVLSSVEHVRLGLKIVKFNHLDREVIIAQMKPSRRVTTVVTASDIQTLVDRLMALVHGAERAGALPQPPAAAATAVHPPVTTAAAVVAATAAVPQPAAVPQLIVVPKPAARAPVPPVTAAAPKPGHIFDAGSGIGRLFSHDANHHQEPMWPVRSPPPFHNHQRHRHDTTQSRRPAALRRRIATPCCSGWCGSASPTAACTT